jgi:PST family polysaccharide transporter
MLSVSRAAWYLYSNADFVVAGRVLGQAAMGIYYMAWNLANIPTDRVLTLILRISPSVLSAVQHDKAELRRYLRVLTEGMALVAVPVGLGAALVADPLVEVFFDRRWFGLAMPLRLLALNAIWRCLFLLVGQVQNTIRDMRYSMWQGIVSLLVLPPAFWYCSRWGGSGIAGAWLTLYPILNIPVLFRVLSKIEMTRRDYFESLKPSSGAAAAMVGAVLGVAHLLSGSSNLVRLIVEVGVGAAVYSGVLWLCFRNRVNAFRALLQRQRAPFSEQAEMAGG